MFTHSPQDIKIAEFMKMTLFKSVSLPDFGENVWTGWRCPLFCFNFFFTYFPSEATVDIADPFIMHRASVWSISNLQ